MSCCLPAEIEAVGQEITSCRQAGCTDEEIRAALTLARQNAVDNFRLYRRQRSATIKTGN